MIFKHFPFPVCFSQCLVSFSFLGLNELFIGGWSHFVFEVREDSFNSVWFIPVFQNGELVRVNLRNISQNLEQSAVPNYDSISWVHAAQIDLCDKFNLRGHSRVVRTTNNLEGVNSSIVICLIKQEITYSQPVFIDKVLTPYGPRIVPFQYVRDISSAGERRLIWTWEGNVITILKTIAARSITNTLLTLLELFKQSEFSWNVTCMIWMRYFPLMLRNGRFVYLMLQLMKQRRQSRLERVTKRLKLPIFSCRVCVYEF